jgi:hypothetical protein
MKALERIVPRQSCDAFLHAAIEVKMRGKRLAAVFGIPKRGKQEAEE